MWFGLNVTLYFVLYAAPDLALTQLLVEVLVFVLIILILYKLPSIQPPRLQVKQTARNVLIACSAGALGFVLVLIASSVPRFEPISNELLRATWMDSHGAANVVNVILTDFRGFDNLRRNYCDCDCRNWGVQPRTRLSFSTLAETCFQQNPLVIRKRLLHD